MKKIGKLKLIGLFIFLSIALVLVGGNFLEADKPDKPPGKPDKGKPKVAFYRVYLSSPGTYGMATDIGCNGQGYVLAEWDDAHNYLHANGTLIDIDQNERIPLLMRLLTDVGWTRKYPTLASGIFNGCYGETDGDHGYHGALFITIGKKKGQSIIRFTWYFGYYTSSSVREHFALFSEDILFPAWKGEDISVPMHGWFDLCYYLNDPDEFIGYESLTGGLGLEFDFNLTINKITQ